MSRASLSKDGVYRVDVRIPVRAELSTIAEVITMRTIMMGETPTGLAELRREATWALYVYGSDSWSDWEKMTDYDDPETRRQAIDTYNALLPRLAKAFGFPEPQPQDYLKDES